MSEASRDSSWSRYFDSEDSTAVGPMQTASSYFILTSGALAAPAADIAFPTPRTGDTTPPTLFSYGPISGGNAQQPTLTFTLGFSENVQAGSGNIVITDLGDNSVFQTIATS